MVMFFTLLLMGAGLSMDAFAVSICKGLSMRKVNKKQCLVIGLFFGGFQALMPFIGWVLGSQFEQYITSIDHWIAFILLGFIGGKMVVEAIREKDEAVGITFAFLQVPIVEAISIIGITTFVISVIGVYVGNFFGNRYKKKAELAGGMILILIGVKILLEHLGILAF